MNLGVAHMPHYTKNGQTRRASYTAQGTARFAMTYLGKESVCVCESVCIHIYIFSYIIYKSLNCTPETNSVMNQPYLNKKKIFLK